MSKLRLPENKLSLVIRPGSLMDIARRCPEPEEPDMRRIVWMVLVIVLAMCSCKKKEARSAIVERVEAAGAGDLTSASFDSIEQWFLKHQDVGSQTKKECLPIQEKAPAGWAETTEGRVCRAAIAASVFNTQPQKSDQYSPPIP